MYKKPPTYPLHPVKMNNARPPCITATAGTELVRTFFYLNSLYFLLITGVYNNAFNPPQNILGSYFRTLSNIPHGCQNV